MELTVLGKYGPYGTAWGGATSGYLLKEENTVIVLDMGSGTLSRLQNFVNIKDITAVYISHLHFDHTSDLLTFGYLLEELKHTVTVFAPLDGSDWCRVLFSNKFFDVVDTSGRKEIKIGHLDCELFLLDHPLQNYAIKVKGEKTFVYTGDTRYTEKIYELLADADLALGDFSKPEGFSGAHITVDKTKEIAEKSRIRLLASHIGPDYDPEKYFENVENVAVAKELETYII